MTLFRGRLTRPLLSTTQPIQRILLAGEAGFEPTMAGSKPAVLDRTRRFSKKQHCSTTWSGWHDSNVQDHYSPRFQAGNATRLRDYTPKFILWFSSSLSDRTEASSLATQATTPICLFYRTNARKVNHGCCIFPFAAILQRNQTRFSPCPTHQLDFSN